MRRKENEGLESGWGSDGTHQVESELLKLSLLKGDGAHMEPLAKLMLHPLNINMKRVFDLISLIINNFNNSLPMKLMNEIARLQIK